MLYLLCTVCTRNQSVCIKRSIMYADLSELVFVLFQGSSEKVAYANDIASASGSSLDSHAANR